MSGVKGVFEEGCCSVGKCERPGGRGQVCCVGFWAVVEEGEADGECWAFAGFELHVVLAFPWFWRRLGV